ILANRADSPPRLLQTTIVAVDKPHDIAILRSDSNPFAAKFHVAFLQLSREPVVPGQSVLALSLHPARPRDAESFQAPREDRSPSQVLAYDPTRLEQSAAPADVFLLSHPVDLGQSGSPVLAVSTGSAEVGPVVGLIEGRWLRPVSTSLMKKS